MFQLRGGRLASAGTRDEHDPQATHNRVLMLANRLAQPPPDAVSHDGIANPPRRHEPGAKGLAIARAQNTQHKQSAAMRDAFFLHAKKLGWAREAARLRKSQRGRVG